MLSYGEYFDKIDNKYNIAIFNTIPPYHHDQIVDLRGFPEYWYHISLQRQFEMMLPLLGSEPAPSRRQRLAMQYRTTLPTELAGTTPKKVDLSIDLEDLKNRSIGY
jgi:hypothetical protein